MSTNLANLEELLQVALHKDQNIACFKPTDIISEKDAVVTSIEVVLNDGTTLNLVAKAPSTKQLFETSNSNLKREVKKDLFEATQASLQRELNFYTIVAPTLRYFQEKEDVDELYFVPVSYGGTNLTCTILLENLKSQGYKNVDVCLNLGTTRQVLKDIASFHAIPIALKLKDPKVFDTKVKRYLSKGIVPDYTQIVSKIIKIVEEESEFASYVGRIKEKFEEVPCEKAIRAPFSTMLHSDCCLRNIMVKSGDGTPDVKLIDFQHCTYGSLAEDLILFLYTSVQTDVLEEHNDGLLEFYHSNFVRVLEECKCDPTPFSLDALLKEMKTVASESQFVHVLSIIFSLFKNKNSEQNIAKEKILFVVREFLQRKWI